MKVCASVLFALCKGDAHSAVKGALSVLPTVGSLCFIRLFKSHNRSKVPDLATHKRVVTCASEFSVEVVALRCFRALS
jgi:hypothetical protein